jgi:hypothetical protein
VPHTRIIQRLKRLFVGVQGEGGRVASIPQCAEDVYASVLFHNQDKMGDNKVSECPAVPVAPAAAVGGQDAVVGVPHAGTIQRLKRL